MKKSLMLEFDSENNFNDKLFSLLLNSGKPLFTRVRNEKRVKRILADPYFISKEKNLEFDYYWK